MINPLYTLKSLRRNFLLLYILVCSYHVSSHVDGKLPTFNPTRVVKNMVISLLSFQCSICNVQFVIFTMMLLYIIFYTMSTLF
jgi:hypothetical protein